MNFSPTHLNRYRQIAALLWKYGRADVVHQMSSHEAFDPEVLTVGKKNADPGQLADDLEAMGPTFVKIGQVLAGRPDIIPEPYRKALARLQDKVLPFPYEDVERIILEELGVRISKAFSRFDIVPIAAASRRSAGRAPGGR
jgi:ubiquinone biosynthesis protein